METGRFFVTLAALAALAGVQAPVPGGADPAGNDRLEAAVRAVVPEAHRSPALSTSLAPAGVACGVWTTPVPLARIAPRFREVSSHASNPLVDTDRRAGALLRLSPRDIIDSAAPVDRSRMARLYRGARITVARAPLREGSRVIGTVVAFEPYPSDDLQRIVAGTALLACAVPAPEPQGPKPKA
jgi:hypothetical protein